MRLLDKLYTSPGEILAKARRDRDALMDAVASGDEIRVRDKLFDFSVTAYHVVDWVKTLYPHLESPVYVHLDSTPALAACRDIANSHKHHTLNLQSAAYRNFPPVVDDLDYSLGPVCSVSIATDNSPSAEPSNDKRLARLMTPKTIFQYCNG
jgi:hypothetical protein